MRIIILLMAILTSDRPISFHQVRIAGIVTPQAIP